MSETKEEFEQYQRSLSFLQRQFKEVKESKAKPSEKEKKTDDLLGQFYQLAATNVTIELVLSCPIGTSFFMKFLESEFNTENLSGYLDVTSFSESVAPTHTNSPPIETVQASVTEFVDKYLKVGSEFELNISGESKMKVLPIMDIVLKNKLTGSAFDEWKVKFKEACASIQHELITNIEDPFQRFMRSKEMKGLARYMLTHEDIESKRKQLNSASNDVAILNQVCDYDYPISNPVNCSIDILRDMIDLYQAQLTKNTENGKYELIVTEECASEKLLQRTSMLQKCTDLKSLKADELLCFFVNIYNLLMLHANLLTTNGVPEEIPERQKFMKRMSYKIGDEVYSLDLILNGIIRGDHRYFSKNDKRAQLILPNRNPDIFFTLITLTKCSPKLGVLTALDVDGQLHQLAEAYVKSHVNISKEFQAILVPSTISGNVCCFHQHNKVTSGKNDVKQDSSSNTPDSNIRNYVSRFVKNIPQDYNFIEISRKTDLSYNCFREYSAIIAEEEKKKEEKKKKELAVTTQQNGSVISVDGGHELLPLNDFQKLSRENLRNWLTLMAFKSENVVARKLSKLKGSQVFMTRDVLSWLENKKDVNKLADRKMAKDFLELLRQNHIIEIELGTATSKISDDYLQSLSVQLNMVEFFNLSQLHCGVVERVRRFGGNTNHKVCLYEHGMLLFDKKQQRPRPILFANGSKVSFFRQNKSFRVTATPYLDEILLVKSEDELITWHSHFSQCSHIEISK